MLKMTLLPRRASIALIVALASALSCAGRALAQAMAIKPLAPPHFSIDRISPTIGGALTADDILDKPGPLITTPGINLGLNRPGDDLNSISLNRSDIVPGQTFMILFGVDRATVGLANPDPLLVAANRPYNVKHQAARNQAAADLFMALDPFNRAGPLLAELRAPVKMNNTLVINQADMGGGDFDLLPLSPAMQGIPPPTPIDEGDGYAYDPGSPPLARAAPTTPGVIESDSTSPATPNLRDAALAGTVFFTLRPGSGSLPLLPGTTNSGADIFRDTLPNAPGGELVYATANFLVLQSPDVIDALLVFDNGNNQFDPPGPGGDQIIFSLARNSPSLPFLGASPADLLVSFGRFVVPNIYVRAEDLGLDGLQDDLDGVELLPTNDPDLTIHERALFLVIPGDYDNDNLLTPNDCAAFLICYTGSGLPYDTDGTTMHNISVGPGPLFTPNFQQVEPGDTVRWTWNGGVANVVSGVAGLPDGHFNSGPPTGLLGTTFDVAFDNAFLNIHPIYQGSYAYFSQMPPDFTMTGTVQVVPDACATFDLDFDGDVDCTDWHLFQEIYTQDGFNPGAPCLLTIPEFVAALLMQPLLPAHNCMADMNADGKSDGKDAQPYVDAMFGS